MHTHMTQDWANEIGARSISPIAAQLADELELVGEQAQRLTIGLAAVFVRGVREAVAEVTAQIVEAGHEATVEFDVDDGWTAK